MRELMVAPVVPDTLARQWTIVHTGKELGGKRTKRYVFTSRAVLERWAATREGGWRWNLLSTTPNTFVIVLDEAWPLKYADPVPEMTSAEDGQRVLEMLLQGEATEPQKLFANSDYPTSSILHNDIGGGTRFLHIVARMHRRYQSYIAFDLAKWTADGELTQDGQLITPRRSEGRCVASPTECLGKISGGKLDLDPGHYVGPVKTFEPYAHQPNKGWKPGNDQGSAPLYLGVLA